MQTVYQREYQTASLLFIKWQGLILSNGEDAITANGELIFELNGRLLFIELNDEVNTEFTSPFKFFTQPEFQIPFFLFVLFSFSCFPYLENLFLIDKIIL
jgi:hypothetical protein